MYWVVISTPATTIARDGWQPRLLRGGSLSDGLEEAREALERTFAVDQCLLAGHEDVE
jgi:hypothetical protein